MADVFCKWMTKTVENPKGTDCTAHLCEGRVFECPYRSAYDAQNRQYPCMDYEPKK